MIDTLTAPFKLDSAPSGQRRRRQLSKQKSPPKLGRKILLVVALLFIIAAGLLWLFEDWRRPEMHFLPIKNVKVDGELRWVDRADLQGVVTRYSGSGLFGLDLDKLRQELEVMPWVQHANVRRLMPGTLYIYVTEHKPVARWNRAELLGRNASVFRPKDNNMQPFENLPSLIGPEYQQRALHATYLDYASRLEQIGLQITELVLDSRRSWRIRLQDDVQLYLGSEQPTIRLQRFEKAYVQNLQPRWSQISAIDLRYTNGFAVRWKQFN